MSNLKSKLTALSISMAVVLTSYTSTVSADAFEGLSMMRMGTWEVDFSGNVNAFVVSGECDPDEVRAPNGQVVGNKVAGGLACGSNGNDYDYNDIRTGLLPSWFNFDAFAPKTAGGWQTAVHLSFQPGVDDASGLTGGGIGGPLGLNTSNFRQIFATLSHENYGTFKIGRDLGVFGSNAILEDMTLLGVGGTGRDLNAGGNSALGRIGFGYIYADWKSQLQYTTPNWSGFSATFAMTDPWGASSLANGAGARTTGAPANDLYAVLAAIGNDVSNNYVDQDDYFSGAYSATQALNPQEEDTFGFEAKVNYAFDLGNDISGHVWASYISQEVDWKNDIRACLGDRHLKPILSNGKPFTLENEAVPTPSDAAAAANFIDGGSLACAELDVDGNAAVDADGNAVLADPYNNGDSADADAYDIGGKLVIGDFDFVAYYYDGEGIGTTDFMVDGFDLGGEERDSDGYYVQARWRTPLGTLLGVSYGESELEATDYDKELLQYAADNRANNPAFPSYDLVEDNQLFVLGAYHPVGEGMNLVLEYSRTESEAHNGNESEEDSVALGAIMFF